jgi:hypothetical protein
VPRPAEHLAPFPSKAPTLPSLPGTPLTTPPTTAPGFADLIAVLTPHDGHARHGSLTRHRCPAEVLSRQSRCAAPPAFGRLSERLPE